ncbi:MAG TPA: hypothetical protein VF492_01045 [Verrucomicrobiae bacterium]
MGVLNEFKIHEIIADNRANLTVIVGSAARLDAKINVAAMLGLKLLQLLNNVG